MTPTPPLHFYALEVDLREFDRWSGMRDIHDRDLATHSLLAELFGEGAPRPYRLVAVRDAPRGMLYGYGPRPIDDLRVTAETLGAPDQLAALPIDRMRGKPMPVVPAGGRVSVETRVRPVRRNGNRELDVFIADGRTESRETAYARWWADTCAHSGLDLDCDTVRLVAFSLVPFSAKRRGGKRPIGPDAVLRGVGKVTDADSFHALIARGVGRHRAYGYGALLLSPARSAANGGASL